MWVGRFRRLAVVATAVVFCLATCAPALAHDEDVRGSCTKRSDWRLKAKSQDGRIEVEGEVDSNRRDQRWRWKIFHDDYVSSKGWAWTRGSGGSFKVERQMIDASGTDEIVWLAVNRRTDERCKGRLAI